MVQTRNAPGLVGLSKCGALSFSSHCKLTPRALAWHDSGLVYVGVNQE